MLKKLLSMVLICSMLCTFFVGITVFAAGEAAVVTADTDADGQPSWQNAVLEETDTEGTYRLINQDIGAGYSFLWTPATGTLAADASSPAAASVVIPSAVNGTTVKSLGQYLCGGRQSTFQTTVEKVILSEGLKKLASHEFDGCKKLCYVKIPFTMTQILEYVFLGCSSLTSIEFPEGLTTISYQCFKQAGLTEVTFPKSLTTIHLDAFPQCASLTKVVFLGNVNNIGITCFDSCHLLDTVVFMGDTAPTRLEASAFNNSGNNTEHMTVYYNKNGTGYDDIENFRSKFKVGTVFIGINDLSEVGTVEPDPGDEEEVESVTVKADTDAEGNPSWQNAVRVLTNVSGQYRLINQDEGAGYSFLWAPVTGTLEADSESLPASSVVIPSEIDGKPVKSIGGYICGGQNSEFRTTVEKVVVSEGITALGDSMLNGCSVLETVLLPNSLQKIGMQVFIGCAALREV